MTFSYANTSYFYIYQTGYGWNVAIAANKFVFPVDCIDVQDNLTWSEATILKNKLQENIDLFRQNNKEEIVGRFDILDIRKK